MRVLLTGAKGMLAQAFLKQIPENWELRDLDIDELDITDSSTVQEYVRAFNPGLIINCAAFAQVDACEEKMTQAFSVNAEGVGHLAEIASETGALLVHFSTDYIFDGKKRLPYVEDDPVCPLNVYGASKWEGECRIRKSLKNYLIIRTQWLYGEGGPNFVNTICKLAHTKTHIEVVNDQIGTPTWTEDLARAVLILIEKEACGTFHLVNEGQASWYDFAREIIKDSDLMLELDPCSTEAFSRPARRPAYSVLSTKKAREKMGYALPSWETALKEFIAIAEGR